MKNTKKVVSLLLTMMLFAFTTNVFAEKVHEGDKTITGTFEVTAVNKPLVIKGDFYMDGSKAKIWLLAGGELIITGNLYASNKITIDKGGKLIVGGDFIAASGTKVNGTALISKECYLYTVGNMDMSSFDGNYLTSGGEAELTAKFPSLMEKLQEHSKVEEPQVPEVETILAGFEAIAYEGYNELIWATSSESKVDYFTIEKSTDSITWDSLVVKYSTLQTTTEATEYKFTDTILESGKVFYRLTKTDLAGTTKTMDVTSVESEALIITVLAGFEAIAYEGYNELIWATSSESKVDYFTIEKSTDSITWDSVGVKYSTLQTTTDATEYDFTDTILESGKVYYKLTKTDLDGVTETLDVISVESEVKEQDETSIDNVSESIFNTNEAQTIIVTSLEGKTLLKDAFDGTEETYNEIIKSLHKGVYILTIQSASKVVSQKIAK